jgi:multidrug resistance efflux pump
MDPLPPIPTPRAQVWREFRIQMLPFLVFAGVVVTVVLLWRAYVVPSPVVGEVETITNRVVTLADGHITDLLVDRFERVTNGQPIAIISTMGSGLQQATLVQIAADLKLMKARMDLDKTRNLDAYSNLRLNLLTEQVNLELARTRLVHAEAEFERASRLYEEKVIGRGAPLSSQTGRNDYGYDVALRDRDGFRAEVRERTKMVAQLEKDAEEMKTSGVVNIAPTDPVIEETIRAQQEVFRRTYEPTVLKAPTDGVISLVLRHTGERVVRGEAVAIITAASSARIVGYLRQPLGEMPTTNDTVTVRTRDQRRFIGQGQIVRVGAHMEPISPALLSDPTRVQLGLPILVSVPEGMPLVPGEVVDLSINFAKR